MAIGDAARRRRMANGWVWYAGPVPGATVAALAYNLVYPRSAQIAAEAPPPAEPHPR
jgi:hypothetical protein